VRRGGFTLIELMIALSISAVMLTAICGTLSGVWMLVRGSASELQAVMHARYIREQLFYRLSGSDGELVEYGLLSAKKIEFTPPSVLSAQPNDTTKEPWNINFATDKRYSIDVSRKNNTDYEYWPGRGTTPRKYQYVYLKVEDGKPEKPGYVAYYDRLVIPIFGIHINNSNDLKDEFNTAIGVKQ